MRSTSKPSKSGNITSNKTRSGRLLRILLIAWDPLNASITWNPSYSRFNRMKRTIRSSSSTISMRRSLKLSSIGLLPNKTKDILVFLSGEDFDEVNLIKWPENCHDFIHQVVEVFALDTARVVELDQMVAWVG